MDPIVRDQLLARFAAYLDGVEEAEAADGPKKEPILE